MKISKEEWRELVKKVKSPWPHQGSMPSEPDIVYNQDPYKDLQFRDPAPAPASKVDHPKHYNQGQHEVIDIIEDWGLGFHCGNVIKYVARHNMKGEPKKDIEKAIWYLQRYLETLK